MSTSPPYTFHRTGIHTAPSTASHHEQHKFSISSGCSIGCTAGIGQFQCSFEKDDNMWLVEFIYCVLGVYVEVLTDFWLVYYQIYVDVEKGRKLTNKFLPLVSPIDVCPAVKLICPMVTMQCVLYTIFWQCSRYYTVQCAVCSTCFAH